MTRREAIAALAAPAVLRGARRPGDKPNVLFLWTDEQRADTLAVHGNTRFKLPVLNRLASDSAVFERCYVSQPVCTPSRSCVMTGLWPHQTGCLNNNIPLKRDIRTMPELVNDSAYRTGYMGKWHLGDEVFAQHGFEDWASIEDGYNKYYSPGRDANAKSSYHHHLLKLGYKPPGGKDRFSRDFAVRRVIEHCKPAFLAAEASRFLLAHSGDPFILYVNFLEPHMPFFGPLNDLHTEEEAPVPQNYPGDKVDREPKSYIEKREGFLKNGFGGQDLKTRAGWQRLNRNYAGLCSQVDAALGRILWALEASGQAENTIVVFTSDHGEMMGAHTLVGKSVMYEEAMRVPLMVRAPFRGQKPEVRRGSYSHADLVPSLLDLLGKKADGLPGHSWFAPHSAQGDVFSQWNTESGEANARTIITQEGLKLVQHDKDNCLLFDRRNDPLEANNLYYKAQHQKTVSELRKRLEGQLKRTSDGFPA